MDDTIFQILLLLFFRGKTAEEATHDVIHVQLPEIVRLVGLGQLQVENVDVFCENNCFSVDQTRRILQAAQKHGFKINFHGEELSYLGSAEVCSLL
jgi:imidazolonepropionase